MCKNLTLIIDKDDFERRVAEKLKERFPDVDGRILEERAYKAVERLADQGITAVLYQADKQKKETKEFTVSVKDNTQELTKCLQTLSNSLRP